MRTISRRSILVGALVGALGVTVGFALSPDAAQATSLSLARAGVVKTEPLVQKAVTVTVHTGRRHRHHGRRWRCWWHRGRRVCGWR
jgi:hypothetical protein